MAENNNKPQVRVLFWMILDRAMMILIQISQSC